MSSDSILAQRGEVYFSFNLSDDITFRKISQSLSVDKFDGLRVWAYANRTEFNRFLTWNLPFLLEQQTWTTVTGNLKSASISHFPTYPEYVALMQKYQDTFPNLCQVTEFGKSVKGRSLFSVRICSNQSANAEMPKVLYVGTIHGDEPVGYVLMLRLIDYLLNNYNQPSIKALLDSTQIWICPLVNPDGTYFGGESSVARATRYNANNVDLNRNFPDQDDNAHPDGNASQPETLAMIQFLKDHPICLSANFHSGSEVVNYPWDYWSASHPDESWFRQVSRTYADTVHAYSPTGFFTDRENGITDGFAWYSVSGGRQDYANYFLGTREITIELNTTKIPDESQLDNLWNYHYRSLIGYLRQGHSGFYGKVTDKDTGDPLKATISISSHDVTGSKVTSDSLNGMYYRLIASGSWSAQVSATGYYTASISSITVTSGSQLQINVPLSKIPADKLLLDSTDITVGPNPVIDILTISLNRPSSSPVAVEVYGLSGQKCLQHSFANGLSDLQLNLSNLPRGLYFVKVKYGSRQTVRKILR